MRLLHVHSGNLYGGVEAVLLTLVRHQSADTGLQSSFALCFEGRLSQELAATGVRPEQLDGVRVSRPWTVARARRRLADLLARRRPDLVMCHSDWSQAIFGPVMRAARIPLVRWLHAPPPTFHWLEWWSRRTRPGLVVANSRFTARAISGESDVPLEIIYPPVPPPAPATGREATQFRVRSSVGALPNEVVIIQVGRMEPLKGQMSLLHALGRLKDLEGWRCWIVGGPQRSFEGAYLRRLETRARKLSIANRVRFLGQRQDVSQLLAAADVFCQPSTGPEGFGVALAEALYAGRPVVSTAIGAASEIVDPTCGVLVPPNDALALAEALRRLITDQGGRAALASAGAARARALCDPEAQIRKLSAVLAPVARA
ncbi:MAG: glycosyltransferase [Gemmatimonadetes bacterium]|nr:glycosyltransferase [Gemmatimonadota bacterium]